MKACYAILHKSSSSAALLAFLLHNIQGRRRGLLAKSQWPRCVRAGGPRFAGLAAGSPPSQPAPRKEKSFPSGQGPGVQAPVRWKFALPKVEAWCESHWTKGRPSKKIRSMLRSNTHCIRVRDCHVPGERRFPVCGKVECTGGARASVKVEGLSRYPRFSRKGKRTQSTAKNPPTKTKVKPEKGSLLQDSYSVFTVWRVHRSWQGAGIGGLAQVDPPRRGTSPLEKHKVWSKTHIG